MNQRLLASISLGILVIAAVNMVNAEGWIRAVLAVVIGGMSVLFINGIAGMFQLKA